DMRLAPVRSVTRRRGMLRGGVLARFLRQLLGHRAGLPEVTERTFSTAVAARSVSENISMLGDNVCGVMPTASAETAHGAKIPSHPASMGLAGHSDMCIHGAVPDMTRRAFGRRI